MSPVNLSAETLEEVVLYKDGMSLIIPDEYMHFAVTWSTFNRVYNENSDKGSEPQRVIDTGNKLDNNWGAVTKLALELVSLECIGGEKDPSGILRPNPVVKSATIFLREFFNIDASIQEHNCHFAGCRPEKREVCNPVGVRPWHDTKMAALLRLIYQVRCNLVHGDKRLNNYGYQLERDHQLVHLSYEIIKIILREVGSEVEAG